MNVDDIINKCRKGEEERYRCGIVVEYNHNHSVILNGDIIDAFTNSITNNTHNDSHNNSNNTDVLYSIGLVYKLIRPVNIHV